jgi:formate hydrogenlyase subunit 3/multisubunit Na+/H+ antiporter MnhD subunit
MISGVILYIIRRRERLVFIIGIVLSLTLAILAWLQPINETYRIGGFSLQLVDSFFVLGRRFVLQPEKAPILVLIYLGLAFWYGGAIAARTKRLFIPIGLVLSALVTAALAVEPFLFAALLIEIAAIVCIPLFSPPGDIVDRGSIRFLVYQTLSMPLILFTGWLLAGAEVSPEDSTLALHAGVLLAIGFSFLLAIFPFHTWMPMVTKKANLYVVAFVYYIFPLIVTLFGLGFLDRYAWLRSSEDLYALLSWTGIFMVIAGGIGAAFDQYLGRMMAYSMVVEIGVTLLTLSVVGDQPGALPLLGVFFASLFPRGLTLGLMALAIIVIGRSSRDDNHMQVYQLQDYKGIALRYPIASSLIVLCLFSMAGFPLLAGFPVRVALWQGLSEQSLGLSALSMLGSVGLIIAGMRTLVVFISGRDEGGWHVEEKGREGILLALGALALFAVGLFPQLFLPALTRMASMFANLGG